MNNFTLEQDICNGSIGVSELARASRWTLNIAAICTILIIIIGVVGNSLTCVALLKCQRVRNITAAFIISLAVADLLFCIFVLPFTVSGFINGSWVHGDTLCKIFPLLRYGNLGVSLLSIAMITINRYTMITSQNLYNKIFKPIWVGFMIAFSWIFSFLMQLPTLLEIWGKFAYDPRLQTCTIMPDKKGRTSKTFLFITGFAVPCIIIIFCYARIFWTVHKSESRMRRHSARSDIRETKNRKNEWRITKMILVIFLCFVFCYLPITIIKVLDKCVNSPVFHVASYILVYVSACVNPIIYVLMNKQYRQAYRQVFLKSSLIGANGRVTFLNKSKPSEQNSQTMISRMSVTNTNFIIRESDPL